MLYVSVNATSANVCVGFDVLGLALELPNVFSFEEQEEFSFSGFEPKYCYKETNLVYQSYIKFFEYINQKPLPVAIGFKGEIPVSRGLGSSSSLIVAGVFGANAIVGDVLSKEELFNICSQIEGHPDNVAPAIYGGLVASYKKEDMVKAINYPVNKDLKFTVLIPSFKISTHEARKVLPKMLEYNDIVHNLSRIIHIPKAFMDGDVDLLCDLFEDRLHEPYRSTLIDGYKEIKDICSKEQVAFAISGSGSTMLMISKDISFLHNIKGDYIIKTLAVGQGVKIWREEK